MKQVIVVNNALNLPEGKLATQVAHASIAAFLNASSEAQSIWLHEGMPKLVVGCDSEAEMVGIHFVADGAGLPAKLIRSDQRTVAPPGSATCLGLGPAEDAEIDAITGNLRVVR